MTHIITLFNEMVLALGVVADF